MDGFGEEDWFLVRMRESIGCYWTCGESLTKALDNKHLNQISVPSGFRQLRTGYGGGAHSRGLTNMALVLVI